MKDQILHDAIQLNKLPGPKPKLVFGNLLDIPSGKLHQTFEMWFDLYSDPYRVNLMSEHYLVSSDVALMNYALRERPAGFRRSTRLSKLISEIGLKGVFTAEGSDWERQRKIIADALKPARIKKFLPKLQLITQNSIDNTHRENVFDALLWTQRFTIEVTTSLTFDSYSANSELGRSTEALQQHLQVFFPHLASRMQAIIPWWRIWKTPGARAIEKASSSIREILSDLLAQGRTKINSEIDESEYSFLEFLLAAGFSEDVIFANALTMLLAGEDTTANTLAWALYYLAQNQSLQEKLRQESQEILGSDSNNWELQLESIGHLKWHEAVVNEVLRIKSAAPALILEANVPHHLPHEKGIISIQTGQRLILLTRKAAIGQHSQAQDSFNPHLWVESENLAVDPKAFLPFGAGPRFCPGRFLSLVESKVFLAYLLSKYSIALAPNHEKVHEISLFTMTPSKISIQLNPL